MTNETNPSLEVPVQMETLKVLIAHPSEASPANVEDNDLNIEYFPADTIKNGESIGFPQLQAALKHAQSAGAQIVFGIDESDSRLSMAVQKHATGAFNLLNVHQTAVIIAHILSVQHPGEDLVIIKSVPVTAMLEKLALKNGHEYKEVLSDNITGAVEGYSEDKVVFAVNENQQFSGSFFTGIYDLMLLLTEKERELRQEGKTLLDLLMELYKRYGFYQEKVFAVDVQAEEKGKHFDKLMEKYRKTPPDLLGFHKLQQVIDFRKLTIKNIEARKTRPMEGEAVDMIRFVYSENVAVTIAPQTNKMLFYISISGSLGGNDSYLEIKEAYNVRMIRFMQALNAITQ